LIIERQNLRRIDIEIGQEDSKLGRIGPGIK
jgi:hypothetical protein